MTVKQLKARLENMPDHAVIVMKDPSDENWTRVDWVGRPAQRRHYASGFRLGKNGSYPVDKTLTVVLK